MGISPQRLQYQLDEALNGRHLLNHPFYKRWSAGEISLEELRHYAGQYRHFEATLPAILASIARDTPDDSSRDGVMRNLNDEVGGEQTHLQLFDEFAAAIGAPVDAIALPATAHLIETYWDCATQGPAQGFAAVLAYEAQASEVSTTKAAGLRDHFALDNDAVKFWDLHGDADRDHAQWALETVAGMSDDVAGVSDAMRNAAAAWYAFLDERDSEALVSVGR